MEGLVSGLRMPDIFNLFHSESQSPDSGFGVWGFGGLGSRVKGLRFVGFGFVGFRVWGVEGFRCVNVGFEV